MQTQLRLEAFYTFNERFAKIRSQRIKKAIKGITGKKKGSAFLDSDDPVQEKNLDKGESSDGRRTRKKGSSISQKGRGKRRKSAMVYQEKSDPDISGEEGSEKDEPQDGATREITELRRVRFYFRAYYFLISSFVCLIYGSSDQFWYHISFLLIYNFLSFWEANYMPNKSVHYS